MLPTFTFRRVGTFVPDRQAACSAGSAFRICFPARLKPIPPKLQSQLRYAGYVRRSISDVIRREFGGQSLVNVLIADVGKSSNDLLTNISETFDNFNVAVTHATKSLLSWFTRTLPRKAENPKRVRINYIKSH